MFSAGRDNMAQDVLRTLSRRRRACLALACATGAYALALGACFYTPPFRGVEVERDSPPFALESNLTTVIDLSANASTVFSIDAIFDRNSLETITYAFIPEGQDADVELLGSSLGSGTLVAADIQTLDGFTQYIGPRSGPANFCLLERALGYRPGSIDLVLSDTLPDDQRVLFDAYLVRIRWTLEYVGDCPQ